MKWKHFERYGEYSPRWWVYYSTSWNVLPRMGNILSRSRNIVTPSRMFSKIGVYYSVSWKLFSRVWGIFSAGWGSISTPSRICSIIWVYFLHFENIPQNMGTLLRRVGNIFMHLENVSQGEGYIPMYSKISSSTKECSPKWEKHYYASENHSLTLRKILNTIIIYILMQLWHKTSNIIILSLESKPTIPYEKYITNQRIKKFFLRFLIENLTKKGYPEKLKRNYWNREAKFKMVYQDKWETCQKMGIRR